MSSSTAGEQLDTLKAASAYLFAHDMGAMVEAVEWAIAQLTDPDATEVQDLDDILGFDPDELVTMGRFNDAMRVIQNRFEDICPTMSPAVMSDSAKKEGRR